MDAPCSGLVGWARELHDETSHSLAGLRLSLSIARRKRGEAVLEGAVTEAIEQLEDGLSKLRALVAIMRNAGFGGAPAVAGVVGILDGVIPEVRAGIARADVKLC